MNRRRLLGLCAGGGLVALSGCVGGLVDAVARTTAHPAFVMPPVGAWDERLRADRSGSLRASNHTTTRSNRYRSTSGPAGDLSVGWTLTASQLRSPEFNEGRADGDGRVFDAPADERERTYGYLGANPVIGERFVLSVPSIDVPGVDDPTADIGPDAVIPTSASFDDADDQSDPTHAIAEVSAFSGVSDVSELPPAINKATPLLWPPRVERSAGSGSRGFPSEWALPNMDGLAAEASKPVVGSARATLANGVELPVLLHGQRIKHGGDYLFVLGWVVDAGALYADATTMLVGGGGPEIVGASRAEATQTEVPEPVTEALSERGQMGSLSFDGRADEGLLAVLPDRFDDGDGLRSFADAARASTGAGRNPQTGKEIKIPAVDGGGGDSDADGIMDLTLVSLDASIVHLTESCEGCMHTDDWIAHR